jgi:hypothetical protein
MKGLTLNLIVQNHNKRVIRQPRKKRLQNDKIRKLCATFKNLN